MTVPFVDIAIIGGGPGGLLLAQGLRKHGIDAQVFERERIRADYVQGFRLGIRQRGIDALAANLPPELFTTFLDTVGRSASQHRTVNERFEPVAAPAQEGREDVHGNKSVSRITLRQILLSGLEDVVHYSRIFESYEEQADGTVIGRFADGSVIRANLIVGADGVNSAVRRQLLPDFRITDTGMRRLAGKIALADAERLGLSDFIDFGTSIRPSSGRGLMVSTHLVDPAAHARHGLIGQDDPTHSDIAGFHFDNTTSYVWWNTAYPQDELAVEEVLASLDGAGLLDVLLARIGDWDERIQRLIRHTDPTTVQLLKVRTSEPGAVWKAGPVTLLGDAIHAMTYFRALGGNTALYDAGLLAAELVAARRDGKLQVHAVGDYEHAMREHGYEAVRSSLSAMLRNISPPPSAAAA